MSDLDVRDRVLDLARLYEEVAALDLTQAAVEALGRPAPGSKLPPGLMEILDAEEVHSALAAVDADAVFWAHDIADDHDLQVPGLTAERLRFVSQHIEHFTQHDDEMLALAFDDDLAERLKEMRRLSRRGTKVIRTGRRCDEYGCTGKLISPLGREGSDKGDTALICDADSRHQVPYSVWSAWPRARVRYITVEHAARKLETTVPAVKMRASRGKWRRIGTGRDVRYDVRDVNAAADGDTGEENTA
jgi:hypothetical protein